MRRFIYLIFGVLITNITWSQDLRAGSGETITTLSDGLLFEGSNVFIDRAASLATTSDTTASGLFIFNGSRTGNIAYKCNIHIDDGHLVSVPNRNQDILGFLGFALNAVTQSGTRSNYPRYYYKKISVTLERWLFYNKIVLGIVLFYGLLMFLGFVIYKKRWGFKKKEWATFNNTETITFTQGQENSESRVIDAEWDEIKKDTVSNDVEELGVKPSFLKKGRRKRVIEKIITVTGVNKGEKLTIDSSKIIYVKASGHYIDLFYFSEQERKMKSRLIRTSMTKFYIDLGIVSSVIRIHRSHYVGLNYVKYIRVNSKGGIVCLTIKNIKLILSETNKEYVKRHVEVYFKDTIEIYG
ncbi:MAG: hypothetical protein ACI9YE_001213 [Psychroserpens sp.]|jgi:hypothetical protein